MVDLTESFDGQEIQLPVDQTAELSLTENPTTGFQWSLVSTGEPVCVLVSESLESDAESHGRAGIHHWQFRSVLAGVGKIELVYQRPWERNATPARTFTLRVSVPSAG
jgi:inhibitor of cysteine peptidase